MDTKIVNEVKHLELKILEYVDKICSENDLKYYLIGGTLLGAVRHSGFIPWDDDIDIGMLRKDYDKLIKLLNNENDIYFLQNFMTDSNYVRYITKVRLNGTSFIERYTKDLAMHHGIFIDIFPLDNIRPENEKRIQMRVMIANQLIRLQKIKAGKVIGHGSLIIKIFDIMRFFLKIIPSKVIGKIVDKLYGLENEKPAKYVTNFSSRYGWRKQTFPIEVYGEGVCLEFEGHQFMAPTKWEVILKSIYGEYMKLPPEENRNSGHDVIHIDLGKYEQHLPNPAGR